MKNNNTEVSQLPLLYLMICLAVLIVFFALTMSITVKAPTNAEDDNSIIEPVVLVINVTTENANIPVKTREEELQERLEELETIEDKKEYYSTYWEIVDDFSDIYDEPERLEDYYTADEIYLIERTVETEVHGGDFDSKCNVASVIFNRIEGDNSFGDTVSSVIKPGQFAYHRTSIDEETALAVRYAYEIGDTTDGCLFFHSNPKTSKFSGADYQFTDNVGHNFYK